MGVEGHRQLLRTLMNNICATLMNIMCDSDEQYKCLKVYRGIRNERPTNELQAPCKLQSKIKKYPKTHLSFNINIFSQVQPEGPGSNTPYISTPPPHK